MSSPAPVKKACDACHRRKVRCSGGQPCKNCGQASLQCTYLAIPQKKGPKGSRAKVISEIRDTQQQQQQQQQQQHHHHHHQHQPHHQHQYQQQQQKQSPHQIVTRTTPPIKADHTTEQNPFDFNTPPLSPLNQVRDLNLLSAQTVDSCINFFFTHLYPTMPIFSHQHLSNLALEYRNAPPEIYCLVLSLCAFIMVQPGMSFEGMPLPASYEEDPTAARYRLAHLLIQEIHRTRKSINYVDQPTVLSVQISFFIFCSYFSLDKTNASWYYLREACTLSHILNMNEETTYKIGDPIENIYKRRFYWLVLITERANALQRHKPPSMLATIDLPSVDETSSEAPVIHGFVYLASLFRLMDDEFMALWNRAKSECSENFLLRLQTQLSDVVPPILECTENQAADIKITQHWLRCMVWQLSITNGYLSSTSPDLSMSFKYPIEIAKELIRDISKLSLQSMEVHGVGLIEKLFDVSCTLSDVIRYVPIEPTNDNTQSPHDCLIRLLDLISRLRGGASRYVPLLMLKVAENSPNMTNLPTHMPRTLEGYNDGPGSAASSPQELLKYHQPMRPVQQGTPQQPMASPALTSPIVGQIHPTPFGEGVQQVSTPQQELLMFEKYSPSLAGHSDASITPPVFGMPGTPQNQYTPLSQSIQLPQPRSIPMACPEMKQEVWDGFRG